MPRVLSIWVISWAVERFWDLAMVFMASQNSGSSDRLVRWPAMVMERLGGPLVIVELMAIEMNYVFVCG